MALQTKTYSLGDYAWQSWSNAYVIELTITEDSTNTAGNYSTISYSFNIKSGGNNRYEAYTPYELKLNGTSVVSGRAYGLLDYNSTKNLTSGTTNVAHNADGTLNMSIEASISKPYNADGSSNKYAPPAMTISESLALTSITRTFTNTITHWRWVGTGGNNSTGSMQSEGTSTFTGTCGSSVTVPSNLASTFVGYYNSGLAGSYWGTSTWSSKSIGDTFTQPAAGVSIEYYYYPNEYTVKYDTSGATSGSVSSQIMTYDSWATISSASNLKKEFNVNLYINDGSGDVDATTVASTLVGWQDHNSITWNGRTYPWYAFDAPFYANTFTDVRNYYGYKKTGLISHWDGYYVNEVHPGGHDPSSPLFSLNYYYSSNKVEFESFYGGAQPKRVYVDHWINHGYREGRPGISSPVNNDNDVYPLGASVANLTTGTNDITLTAKWRLGTFTLPQPPSRSGYSFLGWNTSSDGSGVSYSVGDIITPTSNTNLYAIWSQDFQINLNGNVVSRIYFNNQPVEHLIYNGTQIF